MAIIKKKFCPQCGSEDVELVDSNDRWMCSECGYSGKFPEHSLTAKDGMEEEQEVDPDEEFLKFKKLKKNFVDEDDSEDDIDELEEIEEEVEPKKKIGKVKVVKKVKKIVKKKIGRKR